MLADSSMFYLARRVLITRDFWQGCQQRNFRPGDIGEADETPAWHRGGDRMARVFVSYAHSSDEHRQRVQLFAEDLRRAGLEVHIDSDVALAIGAELAAAPADARQARFHLDDEGKIAGEGLLRFVDAAIGDPKPDELVSEILHDLAGQLSASLDEEIEDEPDVRKRIAA
jgi:hypothetical protein